MNVRSLAAIALMTISSAAAAETYVLDASHTEVRFYWNHAGLTTQSGEWTSVSGEVDFDASDVGATAARISIAASSLHSGYGPLDDHLKGDEFFDVGNYPEITFTSTSAVQIGADTLRLSGDLVIKGETVLRPLMSK